MNTMKMRDIVTTAMHSLCISAKIQNMNEIVQEIIKNAKYVFGGRQAYQVVVSIHNHYNFSNAPETTVDG